MISLPQKSFFENLRINLQIFYARWRREILAGGAALSLLGFFLVGEYALRRLHSPPLKPLVAELKVEASASASIIGTASESASPKEKEQKRVMEEASSQENQQEKQSAPNPPSWTPSPPVHFSTFPTWGTPNNKFGMYINADPGQIREVAPLINSNGGVWGWVLVPMAINQRDGVLWQAIFEAAKAHRVKPLIQLYNNETCDVNQMDFKGLAEFFNTLSWPTKHLYISVFNEVNAIYYWCGRSAPEEYAVVLNTAIDAFKSVNPNFFIMPAGFNSSARSGPRYLDEEDYLLRMNAAVPGIFKKIDGWATHAYPQPEFSGDFYNPPSWYGVRDQIENYKWEMSLLRRHFGVTGLPIFITETGWAHKEGNQPKWQYKPASVTARYFDDAYRNHWLPDNQIVAIMPFVWYKPDAENFNWKREDGTFYPQYDVVMRFPKVAGTDD